MKKNEAELANRHDDGMPKQLYKAIIKNQETIIKNQERIIDMYAELIALLTRIDAALTVIATNTGGGTIENAEQLKAALTTLATKAEGIAAGAGTPVDPQNRNRF